MKILTRLFLWFVIAMCFASTLNIGLVSANELSGQSETTSAKVETLRTEKIKTPKFDSPCADAIFFDGQQIIITANYNRSDLVVTADLTVIDRKLPSNFPVTGSKGIYTLKTPPISAETMMVGKDIAIPFRAQSADGKILVSRSTHKVTLMYKKVSEGAKKVNPLAISDHD